MRVVRLVVAHPHAYGEFRRVGAHPGVAVSAAHHVDGACFAGDLHACAVQAGAGAGGDDGLHQVGEEVGILCAEDAVARVLVLINHHPLAVGDAFDEVGCAEGAAVGEGRIGGGHLHRGRAVGHAAQGQGEVPVAVVQLDPHGGQVAPGGAYADLLDQLHGGDVEAVLQRRPEGHVAVVGIAGVAGLVGAEGGGLVQDDGGSGEPGVLDGRGENGQGLEGATRLTAKVRSPVEAAAGLVAPAADDGPYRAGVCVHRSRCGLNDGAILGIRGKDGFVLKLFVHHGLHGRIEGGVDAVAPGQQHLGGHIQLKLRLVQHRVHEPAVIRLDSGGFDGGECLLDGGVVLGWRQHTLGKHHAQDVFAPFLVVPRRGLDAEIAGGLDGRRQRRCLGRGERCRVHPEGHLRCCLDAVRPLAEVDVVQVHVQDLILGVELLHLQRQPDFLQLAGDGLLAGEVGELHQLLGDGGCTLVKGAGAGVVHRRAQDADHVKARMLVEAQVLRGQECVPHMLGEGGGVDDRAVLPAHQGGEVVAVLVVDRAGLGQAGELGRVEPLPGGHAEIVMSPDDGAAQRQQRDQPAQRLDPPTNAQTHRLLFPLSMRRYDGMHAFTM